EGWFVPPLPVGSLWNVRVTRGARGRKLDVRCWMLEVGGGDWRLETGDWRREIGDWRLEIGEGRLETGDWMPARGGVPPRTRPSLQSVRPPDSRERPAAQPSQVPVSVRHSDETRRLSWQKGQRMKIKLT